MQTTGEKGGSLQRWEVAGAGLSQRLCGIFQTVNKLLPNNAEEKQFVVSVQVSPELES